MQRGINELIGLSVEVLNINSKYLKQFIQKINQ